jgi:hypothetical protein
MTEEYKFIVSVQDFITSRGKKRGVPLDTSGTFEEFHDRMSDLQLETLIQGIQKLEKELGLEPVQVEGETKEERIKFMHDLFKKYK